MVVVPQIVSDIISNTLGKVRQNVEDGMGLLDVMGQPSAKLYMLTEVAALVLYSAALRVCYQNEHKLNKNVEPEDVKPTEEIVHAMMFLICHSVLREISDDEKYNIMDYVRADFKKFTGKNFPESSL